MKADFREYAAWRALGMLSPEEQAAFDAAAEADGDLAAARARVEALAASVSVIHSRPVAPGEDTLAVIRKRCGIPGAGQNVISRARSRPLFAWAGWGVAAALAVLLAVREESGPLTAGGLPDPAKDGAPSVPGRTIPHTSGRVPSREKPRLIGKVPPPSKSSSGVNAPEIPREAPGDAAGPEGEPPTVAHESGAVGAGAPQEAGEKRRLIQEIETLRSELERSRQRDDLMFSPTAGRSWPLIVEMKSPSAVKSENDPPLTSIVADALAGKTLTETKTTEQKDPAATAQVATLPTAIPVYDPARDTGTLAIRNLPAAELGYQYYLWVATSSSGEPVFVGTLPENLRSTDSLDFTLGTTGIVPTAYYLTTNNTLGYSSPVRSTSVSSTIQIKGTLVPPNTSNIVLQGP